MAQRLKVAVRGGDKLNNNEVIALAQVAKVTNLNPFVGEIWGIPGKGTMVGIAGARRLFAEQTGGFIEVTPCSPDEAGATEPDVVIAFKCIANDSKKIATYQKMLLETIEAMRMAGSKDPYEDAKQICGPRPQWIGYGYSTKSETSRMNKTQLARKRAEADALKKCIVIPFGVSIGTYDTADEYGSEALEAVVVEDTTTAAPTTNAPTAAPIQTRPYAPEVLIAKLQENAEKLTGQPVKGNEAQVITMNLNDVFLGDKEKRHTVMYFLTGKENPADLPDNMKLALKKWINPQKDSGDAWHADPLMVKEANAVWEAALKAQGQMTLDD